MTTETGQNQKELPISREDLERMTTYLDSINVEVWTTIEMTPQIWEILWNYREDQFLVRNIEILGHNLFKVEFVFPYYSIVKEGMPNDHVSIVQMQLAIVQWLFVSIWLGIRQNKVNSPMSYETFLLNRWEVLYRRDERTMRKKLKFNERCHLIFKLRESAKKWNIYSIVTDMVRDKDAFLDGWVECVLQDQYLFDEEKKKYKDTRSTENILPQTMVGNVLTRFEANENIKDTISMTDAQENQENAEEVKK